VDAETARFLAFAILGLALGVMIVFIVVLVWYGMACRRRPPP